MGNLTIQEIIVILLALGLLWFGINDGAWDISDSIGIVLGFAIFFISFCITKLAKDFSNNRQKYYGYIEKFYEGLSRTLKKSANKAVGLVFYQNELIRIYVAVSDNALDGEESNDEKIIICKDADIVMRHPMVEDSIDGSEYDFFSDENMEENHAKKHRSCAERKILLYCLEEEFKEKSLQNLKQQEDYKIVIYTKLKACHFCSLLINYFRYKQIPVEVLDKYKMRDLKRIIEEVEEDPNQVEYILTKINSLIE